MNSEEFKKLLQQDLATIGQRHTAYPNDGKKFTHWVLENVFLLSDSDAKTANFDGPNDGGLDGFFVDTSENVVRIIQCKCSETIERDARESFILIPHKLKEPDRIAETNPSIYDCSQQFVRCLMNNFDVQLTFVFLGVNRAEYSDELKNQINKTLSKDERHRYAIEVIGIDELIVRYLARNAFGLNIPAQKDIHFHGETLLEYSAGGLKGLIFHVDGEELAAFGKTPEIFMANFRYFLDLRNKVNNKISETIQDENERSNIWAYNNGITIVCDRFDAPDIPNHRLKIYRPQIVNGCQTVSTLNRPPVHRFSKETVFLVRVIATTDENLQKKIATYTNSQTKVSERTLRSNDPIQRELQHKFNHWTPSSFYDCKEGEWDILSPEQKRRFFNAARNYRRISNADAAKAYLAFWGKSIEAKSSPKLIWDLGAEGLYNFVFPLNRSVEDLLLPFLLAEKFALHIEQTIRELGENPTGDNALIQDYLLHADTTLLASAGYVLRKKYNASLSLDLLRGLVGRVDSFSEQLFALVNSAVKYEVKSARISAESLDQIFSARNFFLRTEALQRITNKIDADIEMFTPVEFFKRCGLG